METKPYSLQSPEQIAKDYGGNKQKIAEAMQMGIIDPTAGTLAAMFIDRMRQAAQTEAAPQQTVAQQAFAPPPMPAGLGATPQAAAMPPLPGAPAPAAAPAQPMPAMAAGGMVPPYMSGGGLSSLPLPDDMFDESRNGGFNDGYRGGGLVAFAGGDTVEEEEDYVYTGKPGEIDETGAIVVDAPQKAPKLSTQYQSGMMFKSPDDLGNYKRDAYGYLDLMKDLAPRATEEAQRYREYLTKMADPEEQKKRRQEDMWMALGQIGAKMASTPGSLLQAASAGMGQALPGVAAAAKERRGEQRALRQALVAEERVANKEISEQADKALDILKNKNTLEEAFQDRNFRNLWEKMASSDRRYVAEVAAAAGITQQGMAGAAQRDVATIGQRGDALRYNFQVNQMIDNMIAPGGSRYTEYLKAPDKNAFISGLRTALGAGANDPLGMRGGR